MWSPHMMGLLFLRRRPKIASSTLRGRATMQRAWQFVVLFLIVEAVAVVCAILLLMRQSWFGAGDLRPFAALTSVFALLFAALAVFSIRPQHRVRLPARVAGSVTGGALVALGCSLVLTLVIGPWTRAFAFSPVICWIVGASAGFLAWGLLPEPAPGSPARARRRKRAKLYLTIACAVLGAVWLTTPRFSLRMNIGNRLWGIGSGHLFVDVRLNKLPFRVFPTWQSPGSWGLNWPHATKCVNGMVNPPVFIGTVYGLPMWIPFTVLAIPTLWLWLSNVRRPVPGHCHGCGYDLTGNVSGRCPECGEACAEAGGAGTLRGPEATGVIDGADQ
jgi:hypothetical protein